MLRQLALRFMIAPKARGQAQALLSSTQELSLVKGEAKARIEEGIRSCRHSPAEPVMQPAVHNASGLTIFPDTIPSFHRSAQEALTPAAFLPEAGILQHIAFQPTSIQKQTRHTNSDESIPTCSQSPVHLTKTRAGRYSSLQLAVLTLWLKDFCKASAQLGHRLRFTLRCNLLISRTVFCFAQLKYPQQVDFKEKCLLPLHTQRDSQSKW